MQTFELLTSSLHRFLTSAFSVIRLEGWERGTVEVKKYEKIREVSQVLIVHKKINSNIGNKIVKEKINALSESQISMTTKLVKYLEENSYKWDESEINKRHNEFAETAYYDAWKIE